MSANAPTDLGIIEWAIVYAIQHEMQVGNIRKEQDFCVAFGNGLTLNEKGIISELRRKGLRAHEASWCNRGPRGLDVSILAPIKETAAGTYEFLLQLGDLSVIQQGEHFGTLLKRCKYAIHSVKGSDPELVSYEQTCCEKDQ